ncbi:MAG TPA: hypothetical protein VK886_09120 [Vicinamibacterales bacterium]|nr:hypothetical protein [Vicinamibacterales bacterium]
MQGRPSFIGAALVAACLAGPATAAAQATPQQRRTAPQGRLAPAELQQLFDSYVLVQAQRALGLSDERYGDFVPRLKALQETRRRHQQVRMRLLRELSLAAAGSGDEEAIRRALEALHEHDAALPAELSKAYAAVEEVLDLKQRARFRLFEENMERRKFELLMRARRQAPANRRRPGPGL